MELFLKNIGIIKETTIKLDGLTVITGRNSSGKTTVSKTLFSLVNAVSNFDEKYSSDKRLFLYVTLDQMLQILVSPYYSIFSRVNSSIDDSMFSIFLTKRYRQIDDLLSLEKFVYQLKSAFELDNFSNYFKSVIESLDNEYKNLFEVVKFNVSKKKITQILTYLEERLRILNSDPLLLSYIRLALQRSLREEMHSQIQPVKFPSVKSFISLTSGEEHYFSVEIENNSIVESKKPCFFKTPYDQAIFIDNLFVFDRIEEQAIRPSSKQFIRQQDTEYSETVYNSGRVIEHQAALAEALCTLSQRSIIEEIFTDDKVKIIRSKLDEIVPGNITKRDDGVYYVVDDLGIKPANLAAGSKLFAIIKMLLEKGFFTKKTLLILDEPEAHLHPEWQNAFAEIIALFVKELGVTVLLTTHSPNFMLAIETYIRKYQIWDKSAFYQTEHLSDGYFVDYLNVDKYDLSSIYYEFTRFFTGIKAERDTLIFTSEAE